MGCMRAVHVWVLQEGVFSDSESQAQVTLKHLTREWLSADRMLGGARDAVAGIEFFHVWEKKEMQ